MPLPRVLRDLKSTPADDAQIGTAANRIFDYPDPLDIVLPSYQTGKTSNALQSADRLNAVEITRECALIAYKPAICRPRRIACQAGSSEQDSSP